MIMTILRQWSLMNMTIEIVVIARLLLTVTNNMMMMMMMMMMRKAGGPAEFLCWWWRNPQHPIALNETSQILAGFGFMHNDLDLSRLHIYLTGQRRNSTGVEPCVSLRCSRWQWSIWGSSDRCHTTRVTVWGQTHGPFQHHCGKMGCPQYRDAQMRTAPNFPAPYVILPWSVPDDNEHSLCYWSSLSLSIITYIYIYFLICSFIYLNIWYLHIQISIDLSRWNSLSLSSGPWCLGDHLRDLLENLLSQQALLRQGVEEVPPTGAHPSVWLAQATVVHHQIHLRREASGDRSSYPSGGQPRCLLHRQSAGDRRYSMHRRS